MTTPDSRRVIRIAAVALVRSDGMTLVVRKRGTTTFIQPGGKLEPGEAADAALRRELGEELQFSGTLGEPEWIGHFTAIAANEPDATVEAEIYLAEVTGEVLPQAEIEEIRWIDPAGPGSIDLAPLTREHLFPALLRRSATASTTRS